MSLVVEDMCEDEEHGDILYLIYAGKAHWQWKCLE